MRADVHDSFARELAGWAAAANDPLPPLVQSACLERLADSIGVAIGAVNEDGPVRAREYALGDDGRSTLWGCGQSSGLEPAVLANGVALRYLDFNDTYFGFAEGCHPSDVLSALIACAEQVRANGRQLLQAMAVSYHVAVRLSDVLRFRERGWDQANITGLAACCGVGRLLGLSAAELEHALGITATAHLVSRQCRIGEVTMWKGFAAAEAVRNATSACLLARVGVHGPEESFVGRWGVLRLLLGDDAHELVDEGLDLGDAPDGVLRTHEKRWPVGYVAQASVDAAAQLHASIGSLDDVERARVSTFGVALELMVGPEKWSPGTRESADHSLPYAVAVALADGVITGRSFDAERRADPRIQEFLGRRLEVECDESFDQQYPYAFPAKVEIVLTDGTELHAEVTYPRGHAEHPLTGPERRQKFDALVLPVLGDAGSHALWSALTRVHEMDDVHELTAAMSTS